MDDDYERRWEEDRDVIDIATTVKEELARTHSWKQTQADTENLRKDLNAQDKSWVVKAELERKFSIKSAKEAEKIAMMEHQTDDRHEAVVEQLSRVSSRKMVNSMVESERQRRLDEDKQLEDQEKASRETVRLQVNVDVENERQRRVERGIPTDEPLFESVCRIANELLRSQNQKSADKLVDDEKYYRVIQDVKLSVMEQLERFVNQKTASEDWMNEFECRMTTEKQKQVMNELNRCFVKLQVLEEEHIEQRRRSLADEDYPLGRSIEERSLLNRAVISYFNRKVSEKMFLNEQETQVNVERFRDVLFCLNRTVNQRNADRDMDSEQQRRLMSAWYENKVVPDVGAAGRLRENIKSQEACRQECIDSSQSDLIRRSSNQALLDTLSAVERLGNQKLANQMMDEEQKVRVMERKKSDVMIQLERYAAGKKADRGTADQMALVNHGMIQNRVLEQLLLRKRILIVVAKTEKERAERMEQQRMEAPESFVDILEQVIRLGNQKNVNEQSNLEQERRILMQRAAKVHDSVVRKVAQTNASKEVSMEQVRRIAVENTNKTIQALERYMNQKMADSQADTEQQRRIHEDVRDVLDSGRDELLSTIERRGNQKTVDAQADEEQENRVLHDRLNRVLIDLVRKINCLRADNDAEDERVRRVTIEKATVVMDQLLLHHRKLMVIDQCETERQGRMQVNEIQRREEFSDFFQVLTQVERRYNQKSADNSSELERQYRVLKVSFAATMEQLERKSNQKAADLLMDVEKARRIVQGLFEQVRQELDRRVNVELVARLADQERLDRIQHISQIYSDEHSLMNEEFLRKLNWQASERLLKFEKVYWKQVDVASSMHEQLVRSANIQRVTEAIEVEQARMKHVTLSRRLHEELISKDSLRSLLSQITLEKTERVLNAATNAMRFAKASKGYLNDIATASPKLVLNKRLYLQEDFDQACDILKNKVTVSMQMNEEQRDRVFDILEEQATGELSRKKSQIDVKFAVDEEKHRRMMEDVEGKHREDDERFFNQKVADFIADVERDARVMENAPPRERPSYLAELLGPDGEYTLVTQAEVSSPRPRIKEFTEADVAFREAFLVEQERRLKEDLMVAWQEAIERRMNQRSADNASELERIRRVHQNLKSDMFGELDKKMAVLLVDKLATNEQHRRIEEADSMDKFEMEKRKLIKDLCRLQIEEERQRQVKLKRPLFHWPTLDTLQTHPLLKK